MLLAEHLRTGCRGRWISGPELFRRLQSDFHAAEDVLAPLLSRWLSDLHVRIGGSDARLRKASR